ncbi:MAG: hypothetical protein ABR575_03145, partial [Actinomycetota bacterium]
MGRSLSWCTCVIALTAACSPADDPAPVARASLSPSPRASSPAPATDPRGLVAQLPEECSELGGAPDEGEITFVAR